MDSTLTQTMFMRGEVQLGKGLQLLRRKVISIPVLRGEVQLERTKNGYPALWISIPVLRGEVQPIEALPQENEQLFQFPYCVGKFNTTLSWTAPTFRQYFNSRTAWGSSTC